MWSKNHLLERQEVQGKSFARWHLSVWADCPAADALSAAQPLGPLAHPSLTQQKPIPPPPPLSPHLPLPSLLLHNSCIKEVSLVMQKLIN